MRVGVTIFRVLLVTAWALIFVVSVLAVRRMGLGAAGAVFFGDLGHPWRAQFNTDFGLHLLLIAGWMIYRTRPWAVGLICGVLAVNLGGVFNFAYILVVSIQARGDMKKLLLGWRAEAGAVSPSRSSKPML